MDIKSAKYDKPRDEEGKIIDGSENGNIIAVIDGVTRFVPLAEGNMHYDTIMELVKSGDLTIADAE